MEDSGGPQKVSASDCARCRYDVFLSFRGTDTRTNFTDHLYTALVKAEFHTFRDDDEIRAGENIGTELERAIRESRISIIVFSKDYASSKWCLREVEQIMERRRTDEHHVLPVFYHVDPAQVGNQTEGYATAFLKHEKRCAGELDRVQRWKKALEEVASLSGKVLGDGHEAGFIEDIVKDVRKKLGKQMLHVPSHLVGREELENDINCWLQNETDDVGVATIYGIGGIGKSTIAKIVYNSNYDKFDGSSFLSNIRETYGGVSSLVRLQLQLLSDLLKDKDINVQNVDEGAMKIKAAVCCRRVLLVLDGVDDLDQFNLITGMREWLLSGSKIIITTRQKELMGTYGTYQRFYVKELDDDGSLKLLCRHAFGQDSPIKEYMDCAERVLQHCGGLPLALEAIGSSLSGKSPSVWENALEKLEVSMHCKVQKILAMSYDFLPDDHDKRLFLDIACFFVRKDKDLTVTILESCGFYAATGIQNLIDRCLLFVDENNEIGMHRLIRGMGRQIVRQEAPEDPGRHSRLWHYKDVLNVLRGELGTETVKGLSIDMRESKDVQHVKNKNIRDAKQCYTEEFFSFKRRRTTFSSWNPVQMVPKFLFSKANEELRTDAFKKMDRLRLLRINHVEITGSFREMPKSLVWLCWHGFSLQSIPEDFCLGNLVALEMCKSRLNHNWKSNKILGQLKILDLSHNNGLIRTPDFKGLPNLERLILRGCKRLDEIDDSIALLQKLRSLDLRECTNLRKLSKNVILLESIEELDLSYCSELQDLPMEVYQLKSLTSLRLDGLFTDKPECAVQKPQESSLSCPARSWFFLILDRLCWDKKLPQLLV